MPGVPIQRDPRFGPIEHAIMERILHEAERLREETDRHLKELAEQKEAELRRIDEMRTLAEGERLQAEVVDGWLREQKEFYRKRLMNDDLRIWMDEYFKGDIEKWKEQQRSSERDQQLFGTLPLMQAKEVWDKMFDQLDPFRRRDPLVLDLDGDGIETTDCSHGGFFDHDKNGFAELSSWVAPDDGLLVMDRNGDGIINDGGELFGDQTVLKSGLKAFNGFEALAELDTNSDGKIDSQDQAFSRLRVWKDSNGDGYSSFAELHSLEERGIKSINLQSAVVKTIDHQLNTTQRVGTFEKQDGSTGQIAEYGFYQDRFYTLPNEWAVVPQDVNAMPILWGHGNVYDLHQAIVRDESGQLKILVEQFANTDDKNARKALLYNILLKWTGSDQITDSRLHFANFDNHKIQMLENFFGEPFKIKGPDGTDDTQPIYRQRIAQGSDGGPVAGPGGVDLIPLPQLRLTDQSVISLNESYRLVFEYMYAQLMIQTHLQDVIGKIVWSTDPETGQLQIDGASVDGMLNDILTNVVDNPEQGGLLLSEFSRTLRGLGFGNTPGYLAIREFFIQQDPELGWVIDTGGLPVYEHVGQGLNPNSPHIEGRDSADAVRGSLTEGDGWLNGQQGDDVIYGTSINETLINESGGAVLVAGGGDDAINRGPYGIHGEAA